MSKKKNKKNKVTGNGSTFPEVKTSDVKKMEKIEVDAAKKTQTKNLIQRLINHETFPLISEEAIKFFAKDSGIKEKTLGAFAGRIQKFYEVVAKKKIGKSKNVEAELENKVRDVVMTVAEAVASKSGKKKPVFEKFHVSKVSKHKKKDKKSGETKEEIIARGKVFVEIDSKPYYIYWDYRDGQIYSGGELFEPTS